MATTAMSASVPERRPSDEMRGRVLVVDDEAPLRETFRYCLHDAGFSVMTAATAEQAQQLVQSHVFDVCFLDLRLGESSAMDLLPDLKIAAPWMRVVIVTAFSSVETAVNAMRAGAVDYLVKPCSPEQLRLAARKQVHERRMELRIAELERASSDHDDALLASQSPAMAHLLATARQVAASDANILLLGESGTGKGVLARAIHGWSRRVTAPFATINCPSLGGDLFESELFGHRRGAFTGAVQNSPGRVSQADGGTLFLDEVGDVPLALQPKLLRFLQDKEYERIGDPVTRRADVRLVAATNRDLSQMAQRGEFRQDLLYRLDVIRLNLPALRERREDIVPLTERFLAGFIAEHGSRARGLSEAARSELRDHSWPGNIRELRNAIERACILCDGELIEPRHLGLGTRSESSSLTANTRIPSLDELERAHILRVIAETDSLEQAARTLGIDSSTLYRKRKQYGL